MSTNNPFNVLGFKLEQKSITQNDFNPALQNYPGGTGDFTTAIAGTWVYGFFRERLPH